MADDAADFYVRFEPMEGVIVGECTDELHPGKSYSRPAGGYRKDYRDKEIVFGWFQVSKFTFGFDVKVSDATELKTETRARGNPATPPARTSPKPKKRDGPFTTPDVSLSKRVDSTSTSSWLNHCYKGLALKRVEAEACRSGGLEGAVKTPFVRLIFEDVTITSVTMNFPENAPPEETLKFNYKRVQMESVWTGNETGERKVGEPRHFGWNFESSTGWTAAN